MPKSGEVTDRLVAFFFEATFRTDKLTIKIIRQIRNVHDAVAKTK